MYEARQNKEKVSQTIGSGGMTKQRMKCLCLQFQLKEGWEKIVKEIIENRDNRERYGITPKNFGSRMNLFYQNSDIVDKPNKKDKETLRVYVAHCLDQLSSGEKEQRTVKENQKNAIAEIRAKLKKIVMRNEHMAGEISNFGKGNGTISGGHLPLEVRNKWSQNADEIKFNPSEDGTCKKSDLTIKKNKYIYSKINDSSSRNNHTIFPMGISLQTLADAMDTAEKTETNEHFTIRLNDKPVVIETIGLKNPNNGTLYPIVE